MSLSLLIWLDICVDLHIMNQLCISSIKAIWHCMQKCVISHIHMLLAITNNYPVIFKVHLIIGNYAFFKKSSQFLGLVRSWTLEESTTFSFLDHIIFSTLLMLLFLYSKIIAATTAKQRIFFLQQMKSITINTTDHNEDINTSPGYWMYPKDTSNLVLLHLWLREYHMKINRKLIRARIFGNLLWNNFS